MKGALLRTMLRTAIAGAVREFSAHPRRAAENLLDLGQSLAKTPAQKDAIRMARARLRQEDVYLRLLQRLAAQTNPETLQTIGSNLAYAALTGIQAPFWQSFCLSDPLPILERELSRGGALFFLYGRPQAGLFRILLENRDRVFLVFLPRGAADSRMVSRLASCRNTALLLEAPEEAADGLAGCLWGIYTLLRDETLSDITGGHWAARAARKAAAACLAAPPDCGPAAREAAALYTRRFRAEPAVPLLLANLPADLERFHFPQTKG